MRALSRRHRCGAARPVRRRGLGLRQSPRLRPRALRRPRPALRLPARYPARSRGGIHALRRRSDEAQVPGPAAGRDHEARHHRRAPARDPTRGPRVGALLRSPLAGEHTGSGALRAEPLHRDPTAPLQPRRDPASARHRAVHQRTAGLHLRAEEQPDEADRGRRGVAVPQGPQPPREALRVRPLHRPLRSGRERGPLLHRAEGQGVMVPPVQPWLERRRRQSAEPARDQDRLPVARGADPREPDQHHRELRPGRRDPGREDRKEEESPDLAPVPPDRRRAAPARRRRSPRGREALPRPALRGQRQEQLHRVARPPTDRALEGRRSHIRLDHRGHRPAHPRQADPGHHQAVRTDPLDRGSRGALGRSATVHRDRQEDHHLDGAEVPLHPRRDRKRATRVELRHHHRRSPLQPGRPHGRGDVAGPVRNRSRRRG